MEVMVFTRRMKPRARKGRARAALLAAVAGIVVLAAGGSAQAQFQNPCSCYYDFECVATGRGDYCSYVGDCWGGNGCECIMKPDVRLATVPPYDQQFPNGVLICAGPAGQPKCDGVCTSERRIGANYKKITPAKIAEVFDLVFEAYIQAGIERGGLPNMEIMNDARAAAIDLPVDWQRQILEAVHDALLTLLGGDVLPPAGDRVFAQVPKLSPEQILLLTSVKEAMVTAIRNGDPSTVIGPILDFWAVNTVEPLHPDHCYPHGHTQAQSVEECQVGQLTGLLTVLTRGQDETCDPSQPDCVDEDPPTCDPESPDCGGGEPTCDPETQDCEGEPPTCDPETQDCGDDGATPCDPATQSCEEGSPTRDRYPGIKSRPGAVQHPLEGRRTRRIPWTRDPGGRSSSGG
jgi:hypothetical protein